MKAATKKQPTRCCAGCSVTEEGYGVWYLGERMNGPYFWPKWFGTLCHHFAGL